MRSDTNCPYCKAEIDINHDDGYGYEEGETHQQQCGVCKKYFVYYTTMVFYYESAKAACLNGSDHDYKANQTYPKEYTKMECLMCGDIRKPTPEEMEIILTPNP